MFTNKFTGKVTVFGEGGSDLLSTLRINHQIDLTSAVTARAEKSNEILSSIEVKYRNYSDIVSTVRTAKSVDLLSSIRVRPHNKMTGIVEVVEPPVIKVQLSPIVDTYAREDMPKLNYGHDHDMFVGTTWGGIRYRSFLRFDISSIPLNKRIKRATLVINLLNSLPSIPIGVYDVPQEWTEYGLTWDNQPSQGTLIKSFDSGAYASETRIDITSYVSEWYDGKRGHKGLMLKALDESVLGRYKQYGTRESDAPPYIEVEYFDPTIYSFGRNDIKSNVFVYGVGESNLQSSVVVKGYIDSSDLDGSLTVRDPKVPVENELPSSIGVNREALPSSVFVFGVGESGLNSSVKVRNTTAEDLNGRAAVNRPELSGKIKVRSYTDIQSTIIVKGKESFDLTSVVYVSVPERGGSVNVRPYDDINSSITVRTETYKELGSQVIISIPERGGEVYIRPYDDISSSVLPRVSDNLDINSSIFIISEFLKASVTVRRPLDEDLNSSTIVRAQLENDLLGKIVPRVSDNNDINVSVGVRRENIVDLSGTVIPRVVSASDVPTTLSVEIASNLPSSIAVRAVADDDLDSKLGVRNEGSLSIDSSIFVRGRRDFDLDSTIIVRLGWFRDLDAQLLVRPERNKDIDSRLKVRIQSAEDLISTLEVGGDIGYVFIM